MEELLEKKTCDGLIKEIKRKEDGRRIIYFSREKEESN